MSDTEIRFRAGRIRQRHAHCCYCNSVRLYVTLVIRACRKVRRTSRSRVHGLGVPLNEEVNPSPPAVPNCYSSKGSVSYWSNPLFLIFDIRALWRSGLSTRVPECQKLKMTG